MLRIGVTMYETSFPTHDPTVRIPKWGQYPLTDVLLKDHVLPILLPTVHPQSMIIHKFVDQIDGLVVGGGDDIDPRTYHESPIEPELTYPLRDFFEKHLILETLHQTKPILGICRGCQMINVALGGNLYQDIYRQIPQKSLLNHEGGRHLVQIKPGSQLSLVLGTQQQVNSRHHQAIHRLGRKLTTVAKAPDGIIEGIESKGALIQGVQWHPEDLWQRDHSQDFLFAAFLKRVQEN